MSVGINNYVIISTERETLYVKLSKIQSFKV